MFQVEKQAFLRKDKTLPIRGVVSAQVAKVIVTGVDATIDADHHFTAMVGWTEGHNSYETSSENMIVNAMAACNRPSLRSSHSAATCQAE